MEMSIYGLNKDSIGQIVACKNIELQAGYEGVTGTVFRGSISNYATPRDGVERKLTLYCWTGREEQRERKCEVSFDENTPFSEIVDNVANDMLSQPPVIIGFIVAVR